MKIAVVVSKFPVVSETFVINHVVALLNQGLDVTVISLAKPSQVQPDHPQFRNGRLHERIIYGPKVPSGKLARLARMLPLLYRSMVRVRQPGILHTLNPLRYGREALDLSLFYNAAAFLNAQRFDIIHCHFGHVGNLVQKAWQHGLVRGKIIVSFHGFDFLQPIMLRKSGNYRELFQNSSGVVANSAFTRLQLEQLGCPAEKIRVIPVLPNVEIFEQQRITAVKPQTGVFRILTIARLVEKKGIQYAIEAVNILVHQYGVPLQYQIIGAGPLRSQLVEMVQRYKLDQYVQFLGAQPQDKVATALTDADVFLLPSIFDSNGDTETQGLVLLEAQMMSVPVVCSNVGGIPDSVKPGESALLVPEKEPGQIAQALLHLHEHPELRRKMGLAGQTYAQENFNPEVLTQKLLTCYSELLSQ